MATRCKFLIREMTDSCLTESTKNDDGTFAQRVIPTRGLSAYPVYSNDPASENAQFWKRTPIGDLRLSTVNAAALADLKAGDEIYIDITKAN